MSLIASDMKRLEDDARRIGTTSGRGYLADALRCLRDTGDPIASLALLRAMWNGSHARRREQKAALEDAGRWLEDRIRRDPGISLHRFELELGWLHRLVAVYRAPDHADLRDWIPPREPSFGAHIDLLRQRREEALVRSAASERPIVPSDPERDASSPSAATPEHLPESFEVRFASWEDARDVFRTVRKRQKQHKTVNERLLSVKPIAAELQPLAHDIAYSVLKTDGMNELQARARKDTGELPSFWIAAADLVEHDGKRVPQRIFFEADR